MRDLLPGDTVTASFYRYTEMGGREPSCQIWAHWNDDPDDLYGFDGDAGGNEEFGTGGEWDLTEWSWFVPYGTGHTGLVIEVRLFSEPGDTIWIDYMTIEAPAHSVVALPGDDPTPATETTWGEIKALFQ
ncbi:MAG: hypothetical protein GF355_07780 [Candidatus Eisenbacteria bacterium]|nr:hypothetical protein [Candidatus Eisenbacteria bacterium]